MRNLRADLDEMDTDEDRRWVTRERRRQGLGPERGVVWEIVHESGRLDGTYEETYVEWIGHSPGDALYMARSMASGARYQRGTGSWILETYEDGENAPDVLRVIAHDDEAWFAQAEQEGERFG